jgi:hypothetical protein
MLETEAILMADYEQLATMTNATEGGWRQSYCY